MATNEHEINRKRRNNHDSEVSSDIGDDDFTKLSLSPPGTTRPRLLSPTPRPPFQEILSHPPPQPPFREIFPHPPLPLQLSPSHPLFMAPPPPPPPPLQPASAATPPSQHRGRKNPASKPRAGKSPTVPAPFPWATTQRATVHSLHHLLQNQIHSISGQVQCKRCEQTFEIDYDLHNKFIAVGKYILQNKHSLRDRAPSIWMNPALPTCRFCNQENSAKPIISGNKKSINWLFLLLGQMLGCCTLEQLKYFCKHTNNHRTGAKDRVLYLTYLGLCKQLDPAGPFDVSVMKK
ncbi:Sialidase [Actinidia chinensis var. chinensis]|uniref:Sialidase n=1 Tax=Actinidia chinensis var. chinensis TaxID=1590841 RepID=A0A2R6RHB6_ACTCC|nr:Sialidase [Actinidia chinensis var. chinensis]